MARKLTKKNTKIQKVVKKIKPIVATPKSTSSAAATTAAMVIPKGEYTEGVGRRKTATARVRIYETPGDFMVNGRVVGQYFANMLNGPALYQLPFEVTGTKNQFAVTAIVTGSGVSAQLRAVVHGLARALVAHNPTWRKALKDQGLLERDDRMKETRKIGTGGKARRKRQSPKR